MKEWTTPDFRNTASATNLEEEEIVDAPGNDGKASMAEQVKRLNPWREMMMMIYIHIHIYMYVYVYYIYNIINLHYICNIIYNIINFNDRTTKLSSIIIITQWDRLR